MSLARIPLALAFPFVARRPPLAFSVLSASGVTDMLDGHLARSLHQVTPMGAVLDGITDKVFLLSVATSLLAIGRISLASFALLGAREFVELPLAIKLARTKRRVRAQKHSANAIGKATTSLQFLGITTSLFGMKRATRVAIAASALTGLVAAVSYWRRALQ